MTEKINTKQLNPVATSLSATINSSTFVMTLQLKDQNNNNIGSEQTIDLPLESVVVSGEYDSENKKIVLTLQNGQEIDIPVGDLISGLQTEITSDNMLSADLVDDTNTTHKFVTTIEKSTWNEKQDTISDLATIRSGASAGATAVQPGDLATVATTGDIADLRNVEITNISDGQYLQYDTVLGKWKNVSSSVSVGFGAITGSPYDNTSLANELNNIDCGTMS